MSEKINNLLSKWDEAKKEIAKNEAKITKYRAIVEKIMDKRGIETISTEDYKLQRRYNNKSTISKADVPSEIWNKYSKQHSFSAFYLTKK